MRCNCVILPLLPDTTKIDTMTIRKRLIISYTVMLLAPVILFFLTSIILRFFYTGEISFEGPVTSEKMRSQTDYTGYFFREINNILLENPDMLKEPDCMNQLEKNLSHSGCGIIVRKDNEIVYKTDFLSASALPGFGTVFIPDNNGKTAAKQQIFLQFDFYFKEGSPGSIFLINRYSETMKTPLAGNIVLLMMILGFLIITNVFLTFLILRSILKPLNLLKSAAEKIQEGKLDAKIVYTKKDEMSDIFMAFEEMRQRLEESLNIQKKYENNRKELISSISHDLRTPLTAIKGYVEGIRDGVADSPEKQKKYLNTIYLKAGIMDHLIDELFLFSKLDLKKCSFNFQKIDLCVYLQNIIEELKLDYKTILINLDCIGPVDVFADRIHLGRVISNLIDNSVKYCGKEVPVINVMVTQESDFIIVKITDNGRGIGPDDILHIFDIFYRCDPSRESKGSGLGLAIAKQIIEEHKGRIWAKSEPGTGTSIFFSLKKG